MDQNSVPPPTDASHIWKFGKAGWRRCVAPATTMKDSVKQARKIKAENLQKTVEIAQVASKKQIETDDTMKTLRE